MAPEDEIVARAQVYSARNQLELKEQLGRGVDGIVFVVQSQIKRGRSAVKVMNANRPIVANGTCISGCKNTV